MWPLDLAVMLQNGAIVGCLTAELILDGSYRTLDIRPLRFSRLTSKTWSLHHMDMGDG